MQASHDNQRIFYDYNYPDPATILKLASGEEGSRSGSRLWERRTQDHDFGVIRLGKGTRPSTVIYKTSEMRNSAGSPKMQDALRLEEDSRYVDNASITIRFRPNPTIDKTAAESDKDKDKDEDEAEYVEEEPRHAIGIVGDNKAKVSDFVRSIMMHYTTFHSPTDARLFVVGAPESRRNWEWAIWLPHTNTRTERYVGDQMCFEEDSVPAFWDALRDELDKRSLRLQDDKDKQTDDITLPHLLVVVDKLDVGEDSRLFAAEAESAASIIMQRGIELGASIIFLVTEPSKVPGDCQAIVEVEPIGTEMAFRYTAIGLNSMRYVGQADTIDPVRAEKQFAYLLRDLAVRRSFGDDIATYIDLLELNNVARIDEMPFLENWRRSVEASNADWIKVPLGLMGGNKIRELYLSQDYDGVHGMIAGTTGSGKSELLLTLVAGLAVNYDPSIVNLALVDYKGGSAFEPFRGLPHTVDIVTNLQGNAVDRMFIAIKAELDRRSKILTDYNVKHIVEYRKKGYHLKEPFPHLLIIVDEFAEMVAENAEFKARFDSITRLGRAIGVSLILATQRPTGAVTDQMRANMKWKICLRVETTDDSRELLKRSDAAFLPSNLPGRAYIQVGNEALELMQVARAGGSYSVDEEVVLDDVIWLEEEEVATEVAEPVEESIASGATLSGQKAADLASVESPPPDGAKGDGSIAYAAQDIADAIQRKPETQVDWVVGTAALLARREDIPRQVKPWPDPLPERLPVNLPIDASYINTEQVTEGTLVLSTFVADWIGQRGVWTPSNWRANPMCVDIGIADNPYASEQRLLTLDLKRSPVVVFGSPGWGKTTFLRTLMLSLAAKHSPTELHMYALDFGKGGLNVLRALPHMGASIDSTEEQRVERLLRMLGNILENRRSRVMQYGSLAAYNAENPDDIMPGVLVVIDNFGELKENFEDKIPTMISLVRDGRAFGIYFAITASQTSDVPSKLYNLFTERLSLKLPDTSEYANIVGRGAPNFNDVRGRGVVNINRMPLEFQCAIPMNPQYGDEAVAEDEGALYEEIAQAMSVAWDGAQPEPVEILPEVILLRSLLPAKLPKPGKAPQKLEPIIGLNDLDRKPTLIDLEKSGPHFIVTGPPLSGKTSTLRTWALSLAHCYPPDRVALVLVDTKKALFSFGGEHSISELPHVLSTVSEQDDVRELVDRLRAEYDDDLLTRLRTVAEADQFREEPEETAPRHVVVIIDNYDDFTSVAGRSLDALGDVARSYGSEGLHFIVGGSQQAMRARDEFMKQVESPRYSLVLQDAEAVRNMGGKVPYGLVKGEYPPGRGFIVKSVRVALAQIGVPYDEYGEDAGAEIDKWIDAIKVHYWPEVAHWRYTGPIDLITKLEQKSSGPEKGGTPIVIPEMSADVQEEFKRQLQEMGIDPADVMGPSETKEE